MADLPQTSLVIHKRSEKNLSSNLSHFDLCAMLIPFCLHFNFYFFTRIECASLGLLCFFDQEEFLIKKNTEVLHEKAYLTYEKVLL